MPVKEKKVYDFLVITGPTATGKTALAAKVASMLGSEVISADSRQVYRGMDIGTGKDLDDYLVNGKRVAVHLIDIADPGYKYNVFEYQRDFIAVFNDLRERGIFPVVCGGSGLYVDSIVSGYRMFEVPADEKLREKLETKPMEELTQLLESFGPLHNITDLDSRKRVIRAIEIETFHRSGPVDQTNFPALNPLIICVSVDRDTRRRRISERLHRRLEIGMVDEVKGLLERGVKAEDLIYYGLEYKFITLFLTGRMEYDKMVRSLEVAIHQFAKRQMTWFRGMEKKGCVIHWLDGNMPFDRLVGEVNDLLLGRRP
jgi:tRNA dimethylallyltransferase